MNTTIIENKVLCTDKKMITVWLSVENAIDNVPEKTIFRIWRHKPRCRRDLGLGYADITNSGEYINQSNIKEALSSLPLGLYELKMIDDLE